MFTICLGCDCTHMQAIVPKRVINVKHDFWQIQQTNKNTAYLIFRSKNFIGVRYDAFVRSILVMAHFVKPSQGAFLLIIAVPRVEHHGRSVLNAWGRFSSWTNVSRDGCQAARNGSRMSMALTKTHNIIAQRIRISWNTRFRPLVLHQALVILLFFHDHQWSKNKAVAHNHAGFYPIQMNLANQNVQCSTKFPPRNQDNQKIFRESPQKRCNSYLVFF